MMRSLGSFDDILTSPWVLWAISVAAAAVMWFYVMETGENDYATRRFSCPLEYRSLDPQATLRGRVSEVEVEIRGLEANITRLDYSAVSCFVDAKSLQPGMRYTQNVRVDLPPNITLVSCVPSQVVLDLARQVTRLIPVEVVLPQDIPDGQYLEEVEVLPKEVSVRGTERDVVRVAALRAMPTAGELQSGRELLLPVRFAQSEPFEDDVLLEPSQVRVRGVLARGQPKKRVPVNVRLSGQPDSDYEIKSVLTDPLEVQLEGPADQLAAVAAVDTETVDISLISADQTLVVPLRSPEAEGVSLPGVKSVRLSLRLEEIRAGKQLSNIPVLQRGGDPSGRWAVAPPSVSVSIEGAPSRIRNVSAADIGLSAYVDLSNIFVTPLVLPVRTDIASKDFHVIKIEPPTVTVSVGAVENSSGW